MRWLRFALLFCVIGGAVQTGHLRVPAQISQPVIAKYHDWTGHQELEAQQVSCRIHVLRAERGYTDSAPVAEQCLQSYGQRTRFDDRSHDSVTGSLARE